MNKYKITNPNNNKVRDYKSHTTESNDAIPHVVKKDKDSIKQFNKTHKTQPD